ncbi:hypothetical protein BDV93DRAFT_604418 [Ceratobasidium sp. AG-I]|nr:hypothetical protein BDV93DRAFT_604418 [Ceratobasidium sp. AG-I]
MNSPTSTEASSPVFDARDELFAQDADSLASSAPDSASDYFKDKDDSDNEDDDDFIPNHSPPASWDRAGTRGRKGEAAEWRSASPLWNVPPAGPVNPTPEPQPIAIPQPVPPLRGLRDLGIIPALPNPHPPAGNIAQGPNILPAPPGTPPPPAAPEMH